MKRLLQAPDIAQATLWCDSLREAGIEATVERQHLTSVAGQVPPDQCLPEIWLRHEEHLEPARGLIDALQNVPQHRWLCRCGELVEGGFETCWNCGEGMPIDV